MNKKSVELKASRHRQISAQNKIFLLNSLEKLADCITNKPPEISNKWYMKFVQALTAVEFWYSRIPELEITPKAAIAKDTCFAKARTLIINDLTEDLRGLCQFIGSIITSLQMIGQLDHGIVVASDLVRRTSTESEEIQSLKAFYDKIFKV